MCSCCLLLPVCDRQLCVMDFPLTIILIFFLLLSFSPPSPLPPPLLLFPLLFCYSFHVPTQHLFWLGRESNILSCLLYQRDRHLKKPTVPLCLILACSSINRPWPTCSFSSSLSLQVGLSQMLPTSPSSTQLTPRLLRPVASDSGTDLAQDPHQSRTLSGYG